MRTNGQMDASPELKRKASGGKKPRLQRKRKKAEEDTTAGGGQNTKKRNNDGKQKSSSPTKKKRNNPPRFQDTPPAVRRWLVSSFKRVEKGSPRTIERNEMHAKYVRYCEESGIDKKMTPNIFGKYIRTVFPDLETCRVGPRNGQVRHYLLESCESNNVKSPEEHRRDAEEPKEEETVKSRRGSESEDSSDKIFTMINGARFESEVDVRESDEEQLEVQDEFGSGSEEASYDNSDEYGYDEEDEDKCYQGGDDTYQTEETGKEKEEEEEEIKYIRQMSPDSLLRSYFTLLTDRGWTALTDIEVETKQERQQAREEFDSLKLVVHSPSDMFVDDEYDNTDNNTYNNNTTTHYDNHYAARQCAFDNNNSNNNSNIITYNHNSSNNNVRQSRTARDLYFMLPVPTDEFLRTNIFLFCEMLCTFEQVLWPFIPLHESFLKRDVVESFPHAVSPQSLAVGVAVASAACVQGHHEFSEWAFNVSCRLAEQLVGYPDVQLPMSFMTLGALAHMWMPFEQAAAFAKRLAFAAMVMCESMNYIHTEVYQQLHNYYALLSRGEADVPTMDEDASYSVDCSPRDEIVRTRTIVRRYITLQASSSWAASQVKKQFSTTDMQHLPVAKHLQRHVLEGLKTNLINKCNELLFLPVSDCVRTHLSSSLFSVLVEIHFLLDDIEGALRMGLKLLHVLETDPVPYIVQFCYGLLDLFLKCDSPEHVHTLMYILVRVRRIKAIETFLLLCQYRLAEYNAAHGISSPQLTPP